MILNERMDKENMVHLHNRTLKKNHKKKQKTGWEVIAHAFNPSTQKVETGGSLYDRV